ncbi:hypothetical protein [Nonomuraea basaltis]|uniref:hypothetical protein n=1 Tax=Nonomuraea basaltis TaxID=2495887 RepID=UPI00110C608F|nr:hypothetical protein [Nonomuraea basaltis]TMR89425.1 hypothetical protein EJK15_60865 [Nonomuraea basaltis]
MGRERAEDFLEGHVIRPMAARRLRKWWPAAPVAVVVATVLWPSVQVTPASHDETVRETTSAESDLLHRAEEILVRDCMAQKGFRYWPKPLDPVLDYREFPYVVDDVKWAKAHGYGRDIERALDWEDRFSPRALYYRALPEDRLRAAKISLIGERPEGLEVTHPLIGSMTHSDRGCVAEAWRQLYHDAEAWFGAKQVTSSLSGMRMSLVTADAAFRQRIAHWSRCMRARGFTTPDPLALRRERLATEGPYTGAEERRAAVAEAECAHSSGLAKTARERDIHYAAVVRERYRPFFDTLGRLQQAALPQARLIVGKS